jgi:hypothetical protein
MITETRATFRVEHFDRVEPAVRPQGLFAAWWLGWQSFVTATGALGGEQTAEITRARLRGGLLK